ncbi:TetR/AcrR family transcriptional regulator [Rugamonas sp.]|uniref:TetR/AcrR family transcriptional regulator n=1 Tax=Rugamonas sp. TaxID=1926287 RepID=UPI0025FC6EC7|nr:TetR/AcrR family transcriptional regulator [Rugamonas sp.]
MKKSVAETAATRKRIISTAYKLFLSRGLAATGVSDIMNAAGMTAGAFYRHFETKEQLIAEGNVAAFEQLAAMFKSAIAGKPARAALNALVRIYLRQAEQAEPAFLCPLGNVGSELRHADAQGRDAANAGYARLVGAVELHVEKLKVAGHRQIAESIVSTMVGAVTLSQAVGDRSAGAAILNSAEKTIALLLDLAPRAAIQAPA